MTATTIAALLLALMTTVSPPGRTMPPAAAETPEQGSVRYQELSGIWAEVVADEGPLPDADAAMSAALVAATTFAESGWRRDVLEGRKLGPGGTCGAFQIMLGPHVREVRTCAELVADRKREARIGYRMLRRSMNACRRFGRDAALRVYLSGSCAGGVRESAARMRLARRWRQLYAPPT